jgi:hypothetical protein
MTDAITKLRALHEAATPGPWRQDDGGADDWIVAGPCGEFIADIGWLGAVNSDAPARPDEDSALIAAARNALPALLDIAEAARAYLEAMEGVCPYAKQREAMFRLQDSLDAISDAVRTRTPRGGE